MPEPTPEAPQADATEAPQEEAPTTFDADYVAKLRQEAAKYRTEAKSMKAAADELAKIKAAQQTEAERLAEARTLAEQQATEYRQKYTGLLTLQQVTDAVNAQTDTIRTGVTDYIRESVVTPQVTEAVTQAARATVEEEIRGKHMDEITAAVTDAVRAAATEKATEQAKQTALTTVLATLNKTMDDYNNMNALEKGVIDAAVSVAMIGSGVPAGTIVRARRIYPSASVV